MKGRISPQKRAKTTLYYLILLACMIFLGYALPYREPISFALYFAALCCGLNPFVCAAEYLLASFPALSLEASLSAAVQAVVLLLIFLVYRRMRRPVGSERLIYALLCQLPFVLLFPHAGYPLLPLPPIWQKALLALLFTLICALSDGALHALLFRAFRSRLPAHALAELCTLWTLVGVGILRAAGKTPFLLLTLCALLFAVLLLKNATALPFALALSLPLCLLEKSLLPCAHFCVYGGVALLFTPYGKPAASCALTLAFLVVEYANGLFLRTTAEIVLRLLACVLPALLLSLLPARVYERAKSSLLFYRERTLPRIAINRNRRAIGERLYEVSALFREIGLAFIPQTEEDGSRGYLRETLTDNLCKKCKNARNCARTGVFESLDKLIQVGCAKGKVSLIDLPETLASNCSNSAGLLFALNQRLVEYRRFSNERENTLAGRRLLAEQARGVSEILKNIALEQSEEICFSEGEQALAKALSTAGILSSEIFLYGEGSGLTVSMTLAEGTDGKRVCAVASQALGVPLSLAEKLPLTSDRTCFVLRRKARFDAAFGVAAKAKENASASGDTHSILKIDERRLLVALSDGMGSGSEARAVSDGTLSLIESFYKAKMPSEIILSTVNRLLSFSGKETFSCLDLATVDLDTGIADVVKIGAPVGFILSAEKLRVLEGESLPMGMLETIRPATLRAELQENDFLLFMSDGVTGAFGSSTELYAYLSELRPLNPQSLAEEVLAAALARYHGRAEDDMTVIAVRMMAA